VDGWDLMTLEVFFNLNDSMFFLMIKNCRITVVVDKFLSMCVRQII